jgi:ankyrin repeat protein
MPKFREKWNLLLNKPEFKKMKKRYNAFTKALDKLTQKFTYDVVDDHDNTPLHLAARNGHATIV